MRLRLAVDTGAAMTLIRPSVLSRAGIGQSRAAGEAHFAGVVGSAYAPTFIADEITAAGLSRYRLRVISADLAVSEHIDGLLGLDFLAGQRLTIDLGARTIEIEPSNAM